MVPQQRNSIVPVQLELGVWLECRNKTTVFDLTSSAIFLYKGMNL